MGERERLMDQIEASVILPDGASPLDQYGRYYAWREPDVVAVAYYAGAITHRSDENCLDPAPLTEAEWDRETVIEAGERGVCRVSRGDRAWYEYWGALPVADDAGCGSITFEFYTATASFEQMECSGSHEGFSSV